MLKHGKFMNQKMLLTWISILLSTIFIPISLADYNETSITVDVNVSTVTEIRINPTYLNWVQVEPGTAGGEKEIDVINIGSVNVTGMYGYLDTITVESSNPIGSSSASDYGAGGFLTMKRNESSAEHYFTGRLEWNYTDWIELSSMPTGAVSWGWFRNASSEYVWGLVNGTPLNDSGSGACNHTGSALRVNKWDDVGNTTTRDLADVASNYVNANLETETEDWGIFSFASGPWNGYCIAADANCTKLYVYKFDRRATGSTNFVGCANIAFLNTTMYIGSSELQTINLDAWVPYGIPYGDTSQGILTIYAES